MNSKIAFFLLLILAPFHGQAVELFFMERHNDPEGKEVIKLHCDQEEYCFVFFDYDFHHTKGIIDKKKVYEFIKNGQFDKVEQKFNKDCDLRNFTVHWKLNLNSNFLREGFVCRGLGKLPDQVLLFEAFLNKVPSGKVQNR